MTWTDGGERQSRCILGMEVPKEVLALEAGDPSTEEKCAELERKKRACLEIEESSPTTNDPEPKHRT